MGDLDETIEMKGKKKQEAKKASSQSKQLKTSAKKTGKEGNNLKEQGEKVALSVKQILEKVDKKTENLQASFLKEMGVTQLKPKVQKAGDAVKTATADAKKAADAAEKVTTKTRAHVKELHRKADNGDDVSKELVKVRED